PIIGFGLGMGMASSVLGGSRFREELRAGHQPGDAVARTMATAGKTVVVSSLTVALSLASLLIFPEVFLRSMAFGGMAAVLVAMVASLTVLPVMLSRTYRDPGPGCLGGATSGTDRAHPVRPGGGRDDGGRQPRPDRAHNRRLHRPVRRHCRVHRRAGYPSASQAGAQHRRSRRGCSTR